MLAIPKQTDPLITALLGNIDKSNNAIVKSENSISLSAALSTAQKAMPNTRLAWVDTRQITMRYIVLGSKPKAIPLIAFLTVLYK